MLCCSSLTPPLAVVVHPVTAVIMSMACIHTHTTPTITLISIHFFVFRLFLIKVLLTVYF
jgi:hypothetical protein